MKILTRSLVAAAALAMPALITSPAEAADAGVFIISGSGTISPGLTPVPDDQSINFSGTATVIGTQSGSYGCSFSGNDPAGSTAAGSGTVSGGCGPISNLTCTFVRVAGVVQVVCVDAAGTRVAEATCVFTPTDVNPTTRYTLTCVGTYADA